MMSSSTGSATTAATVATTATPAPSTAEKKVKADVRQKAIKLVANAAYGFTGSSAPKLAKSTRTDGAKPLHQNNSKEGDAAKVAEPVHARDDSTECADFTRFEALYRATTQAFAEWRLASTELAMAETGLSGLLVDEVKPEELSCAARSQQANAELSAAIDTHLQLYPKCWRTPDCEFLKTSLAERSSEIDSAHDTASDNDTDSTNRYRLLDGH